jgi:hypothetical protein
MKATRPVEFDQDARHALARRLRALRENRWSGIKITQQQLALALGKLSVPLISSYESLSNPKIPPVPRLHDYSTFFATPRSLEGAEPHRLTPEEMTEAERREKDDLNRELMKLRADAMRATGEGAPADPVAAPDPGLWHFADGMPVTIVCAQLPDELLAQMPFTNREDPDFIALYTYADLDALFELHGHVRAMNPRTQVNLRAAHRLASDDYATHLVLLGGVDWNIATEALMKRLPIPVQQVDDPASIERAYFVVGDERRRIYANVDRSGGAEVLKEDVAFFARAVNPYNRLRTVTICNGMYGGGTYGAVRAFTDARFRDRNTAFARSRFTKSDSFCLIGRVTVERGVPLTPDWTIKDNRLFEWEGSAR